MRSLYGDARFSRRDLVAVVVAATIAVGHLVGAVACARAEPRVGATTGDAPGAVRGSHDAGTPVGNDDGGTPIGGAGGAATLHDALAKIATKRIFFDHASIGQQTLDALKTLAVEQGVTFTWQQYDGNDAVFNGGPIFASMPYITATNTHPIDKISDFAISANQIGSRADLMMMKLCFTDFSYPSSGTATQKDPARIESTYQSTLALLMSTYPTVKFLHMTAPVTRPPNYAADNIDRNTYSNWVRVTYPASNVFDVQLHESTNANGTREMDTANNLPQLSADWADPDDNAHLSAAGARMIATQLALKLAGLL